MIKKLFYIICLVTVFLVSCGRNNVAISQDEAEANTETIEKQYNNPIDSYFLPLFDESEKISGAEYRNLQEIYGLVWKLEYKNMILWLLNKCDFEKDRRNIEAFEESVLNYIKSVEPVFRTEKYDAYHFSPNSGDVSRIGGVGLSSWMMYMEGNIYKDVCMSVIGLNDSDSSQYEFVDRNYSNLTAEYLYRELNEE